MDGFSGSEHLSEKDRVRLNQIAEQFQAVRGQEPAAATMKLIRSVLPEPGDQLHLHALWRLIAEDLEIRWQRGDHP